MVKLLRRKGQMDRTWIVLTSDHGYHMGQFSMPIDKRLPYETDIRVPLLVIAPSNNQQPSPNKTNNNNIVIDSLSVVSIDLAPTVLDMARVLIPNDMDGVSLLPLIADALASSSPLKVNIIYTTFQCVAMSRDFVAINGNVHHRMRPPSRYNIVKSLNRIRFEGARELIVMACISPPHTLINFGSSMLHSTHIHLVEQTTEPWLLLLNLQQRNSSALN